MKKHSFRIFGIILLLLVVFITGYALSSPQVRREVRQSRENSNVNSSKTEKTKTQTINDVIPIIDEDSIPDSLRYVHWKVQRTQPLTEKDLKRNATDLERPDNLKYTVVYNDSLDRYIIGTKIDGTYVSAPIMMTREEYLRWSGKQSRDSFYRNKNDEIYRRKGKEKFDFSDMKFDLGPAEKIFGPGGVRIKTQGTAEIKLGATLKNVENPSLPIRNRKTTTMNFDERINVSVNGKVGDKVNMNLNYNTDATFDFDSQNLKLKYDGKEDEIIKLVEAGNVSFPSNSSLINGASSLFGIRTDLQFGKLKLQMVASQKKSTSKSVSSSGGIQTTPFDIKASSYEENRHFFLAQYFKDRYDNWMATLPTVVSGITINRIEVWVTNKTGTTTNTRNIIALTDLGEVSNISNPLWSASGIVPANTSNSEYPTLTTSYSSARDIDQTNTILDGISGFIGGNDYEKIESARLLSSSEYTVNTSLGYISLNSVLQSDQVLAVAYEYTSGGVTYQVGEFAADITNTSQALFVKSLKNTNNSPSQGNWGLMMKNVYYLASSVEKSRFRLDVKYESDTTGTSLTYIPETAVKNVPLIRVIGADRLDNNNNVHPNGYFDFVSEYTVSNGRVFLPKVEPFGSYMYNYLISNGIPANVAEKYSFTELYNSTKTTAQQVAEKNKYTLVGQFRGTLANVISLGAYNVPQGSVLVTAGGVKLNEGSDYSVDYAAGEVTIINQSIIDAGTSINVSLESNTDYGQQRKTMFGLNWEYNFSKDFQLSGTLQHLTEQALTTKVSIGSEPLNNTLFGFNINWRKESQWLTNLLGKIPFLNVKEPSQISFNGEFAKLFVGQVSGIQDDASYIDDFENTESNIDISTPTSWTISSVPAMFSEYNDKTTLASGFNRSLLAWYYIDPLFTRRSSTLTPSHIRSDLNQLSNHYVREIYTRELFPNRSQNTYSGESSTLSVLNMAYYPNERGPYNFSTELDTRGHLTQPTKRWGGMMRRLDTNDFETANIEYIEFWMLDPFIYSNGTANASEYGGDFYINLGEISEDILKDGKKSYESGLPVDGSSSYTTTQWGKIPTQATTVYAFATSEGARALQDVGYDGLTNEEERTFANFQAYLTAIQGTVSPAVFDSIFNDPANDDYHYFRGTDYDNAQLSILDRYKRINNPQGNSPDSNSRTESYDTSYKTTPDVEDINQDYTLNEYERYYQYRISIRPGDLVVGQNFIVDKRETSWTLRNGNSETVSWYLFRIPVDQYESRVGSISDFTSIRFMRMFLTNFRRPIVMRMATLDLVRGEWRTYYNALGTNGTATLASGAVSYEENGEKTPVNYVLPPGIQRSTDPTQSQLVEEDEQALSLTVNGLTTGEAKAVYKNTSLDLRGYKKLQMFVHANALEPNTTDLTNGQVSLFIRLGSDYRNNYYEYDIPLTLTPAGRYSAYSLADVQAVWPESNMLDIPLSLFTTIKKTRNRARSSGIASYTTLYSAYDENRPNNRVSIMGNPTLGEIKTMIIGIRNNATTQKSVEVWVNELRLKEYDSDGGWAAKGNLNVKLSDFGTLNMQGRYISEGFGGLEDGVSQRTTDNYFNYNVTTNLELGKFFPEKAKVTAPLYYSITKEETRPKYNPLDTDLLLSEALDATANKQERDSIESITVTRTTNRNFSLSNVRVGIQNKRHPMPWDPANFTFSYSNSFKETNGQTTVYERETNWRGAFSYSWSPIYKIYEPFSKIKNRSKWLDIARRFGLNYMPQNISFNSEITRNYYELQERDLETMNNTSLPLTFNSQFLWNRDFAFRWDLTRNLHLTFQNATHAEITEPYTPVNKNLYPEAYQAWKDSVWTSIKHLGEPLDYSQTLTVSYQAPLNLIPALNWVNLNGTYTSTYTWLRGTNLENGTSLGNTITTNRNTNINSTFDLIKLYNQIPFLKKVNDHFNKAIVKKNVKAQTSRKTQTQKTKQAQQEESLKRTLPKNKNSFEQEITLLPDTTLKITHNKRTNRIIVAAKTEDGRTFNLRYKRKGNNDIVIKNKVDSALKLKITVTPREPLENQSWYKAAQNVARLAMMVRSVGISYRNQYALSLPGFMPNIGDFTGQGKAGGMTSPGLDFAFGFVGDNYINKAKDLGWLLLNDSIATPATTTHTEDLQIRATLEPVRNLKIELNASRTQTKAKSIQYMYSGNPTTESGTFTMTTISLRSAFEGIGNANNGYHSPSFERFVSSLDNFRARVEAQYQESIYPLGTALAGQTFNTSNGTVDRYSSDVMIPAFLSTYTSSGGGSLSLFPTLTHLLPNWTVRYSGLSTLPWFKDVFKSINLNHSYKSIFAIGSYSTYSTFMEYMNGLGFVTNATTNNPTPSTMYNISSVSVNEAFSPLLGIDVTFHNNMTTRLEYRTTRVLALSTTSIQINEAVSRDWVIGWAYKINNFDIFSLGKKRTVKNKNRSNSTTLSPNNKNSKSSRSTLNKDLNLRLDLSYRNQANITRDISTLTNAASSGNTAIKISFAANYTLSRMLTMSFYYDRQTNTPLLSSNSYPTTTQDFGLSIKFSLTR